MPDAPCRPLVRMAHTASAARAGLAEIGHMHRYAAHAVTTTLALVQALTKTTEYARRMTPAKKALVQRLTQAYLWAMLSVADEADSAIREALGRPMLLSQIGGVERRRIDQITEVYLQHVRDVLRR